MLTAKDRWRRPERRDDPVRETVAVAVSAALHALAMGILLLRPGGRALPQPTPPLEIEMVQQQAEVRGAPAPPAAPAPAPSPAAAPPASPPAPPIPPNPQSPPSAAPSPAAPPMQAQRRSSTQRAPEVNLGNSAEDFDPLSVTGDNVVPAGPDSRYRNLPPRYPVAASRIGAEGTVQLVAHIAPNGLPLSVGVVESSGNTDLDEEARRAVLLWRFRPAREKGRAVAYDYVLDIRFALGDH